MTVSIRDIQDYLDWRQEVNAAGIRDSVEDFAEYREQVSRSERVEVTNKFLRDLAANYDDGETISSSEMKVAIELLTGVEYRPDDV